MKKRIYILTSYLVTLVTKAHISFLLFCKQSVQLIPAGRRFILLPVGNDAKQDMLSTIF